MWPCHDATQIAVSQKLLHRDVMLLQRWEKVCVMEPSQRNNWHGCCPNNSLNLAEPAHPAKSCYVPCTTVGLCGPIIAFASQSCSLRRQNVPLKSQNTPCSRLAQRKLFCHVKTQQLPSGELPFKENEILNI